MTAKSETINKATINKIRYANPLCACKKTLCKSIDKFLKCKYIKISQTACRLQNLNNEFIKSIE